MNKKILIIFASIVGIAYAGGNAQLVLNFSDITTQSFKDKFSLIHFTAPGNNFVGSFLRLPSISTTGTTIVLSGDSKTCTKQLRGLYFNAQRGNRLWPLDSQTLDVLKLQSTGYANLEIKGGLYTTCSGNDNRNIYSVFGGITYVRGGITGYLVAGTKLDYHNNKMIPKFSKSLQYFDNKVIMGYIYDSNGGIGYLGGIMSGHENLIEYLSGGGAINSGFMYSGDQIISNTGQREILTGNTNGNNAMETMRNMIVKGSVGISKSMDESERLSLLGNFDNRTVIYNGSDINASTLINTAKKNAQTLCQGKEWYKEDTLGIESGNVICIQDKNITIDLAATDTYKNKTILIKSGNVILSGGMNQDSPPLDLFIDRGLLYLPENIIFQDFNDGGFPSDNNTTNSGLYIKGNFIINGLILGGGATGFNHKLHMQGKITILNTPLAPNQARRDQIENLFGTNGYTDFINLQKIFVRTCQFNGTGSDGTPCSTGGTISTTPLVILNGNYPSNVLK